MNAAPPKQKSLPVRILSGSLVLLSGSGLTAAINLAYNVAVARFLGPDGFGQATAVYTVLTFVSAVTLSYQMMAAKGTGRQASSEAIEEVDLRASGWSAWVSGGVIALALLAGRHSIQAYLHLSSALPIVLLALGTLFYVPLGFRRGRVQGAYGFRSLAANLVLEGLVRLGGSVLLAFLGYGVVGVIAANAVAIAIAYAALTPPSSSKPKEPMRLRQVHRELGQTVVFYAGQMLINNCDILLVKHFFPPAAAGLYAVVAMVGRVMFALCQAVVNSMVPVVAGTREEERQSLRLLGTALVLVLGMGVLFVVGLLAAPVGLWSGLFGHGFAAAGGYSLPTLLALYALLTVVYSLSAVMISYEMSYRIANTSWVQFVFSGLIVAGILRFHASLQQVILVQIILVSLMLLPVATPFLRRARKKGERPASASDAGIRLLRRVPEDDAIAAFLQSDFHKASYGRYHDALHTLVHAPNLTNQSERAQRRALFETRHLALWSELPNDTEWWEAEMGAADLGRIRVFPRAQWRKLARGNFKVVNVAERLQIRNRPTDRLLSKIESIRECLASGEAAMGSVLLIGVGGAEPFAILDGNHRLVAAVLEGRMDRLRFLCGVSPAMTHCCWYRTSPRTIARYVGHLLHHLTRDLHGELARLLEGNASLPANNSFSDMERESRSHLHADARRTI